mmetsp:Transcript_2204/g.5191  ORF Transcript_2204/g.5191 Transcript_2204/m.5191 type:complete len:312 (+) Transcript_2204:155-1090(+)|eukprot:CAMPEP_0178994950 /NCGR_PEP_ID=MMETSP0795-20121207/7572_1 /TAXON_ID=88552 /ORGANISM="Amoebophrya sp., Strain Ameob2" /LENGTH=311 /DNA_ID=CAMNT_0020687235 /DNA_START=125 /DNA_END=1060 /DNA_ORIENTATION=-
MIQPDDGCPECEARSVSDAVAGAPPELPPPASAEDRKQQFSAERLAALTKDLSMKKKFRATCTELTALVDCTGLAVADLAALCKSADRCQTVLTTRFTGMVFWQSGLEFFLALQFRLEVEEMETARAAPAAAEVKSLLEKVKAFVLQALSELDEDARSRLLADRTAERQQRQQRLRAEEGSVRQTAQNLRTGNFASFEEFVRALGPPGMFEIVQDNDPRKVHHLDRHELRIVDNFDEELTCVICMERIGKKAKQMPECGHLFHDACIMEALEHNKSCPMCRRDELKGQQVWTTDDFRKAEKFGEEKQGMFS